jgi:acetyltransferase-like isoleucine patch superfamily enzyme
MRGLGLKFSIILNGGNCAGVPMVDPGVFYKYPPHAGWKIGKGFRVGPGCYFDVPKNAVLEIGERVKFTKDVVLSSACFVRIGDDSLVAEFVSIRDSSHKINKGALIGTQELHVGRVLVGRDVWLGKGVTIVGNVEVGDGAVLGVSALVKDVSLPGNKVFVGIPARELKDR